jgi:hypothetical protein
MMAREHSSRSSPSAPPERTQSNAPPGGTEWLDWVRTQWPAVRVAAVEVSPATPGAPDAPRQVRVSVHLGALTPADVNVLFVAGDEAAARNPMHDGVPLWCGHAYGNGVYMYEAEIPRAALEGAHGYAVRVVPDRYRLLNAIPPVVHHARAAAAEQPAPRRSGESVAPLDVAQEPEVRSRRGTER